jgi:hypothetical protein
MLEHSSPYRKRGHIPTLTFHTMEIFDLSPTQRVKEVDKEMHVKGRVFFLN